MVAGRLLASTALPARSKYVRQSTGNHSACVGTLPIDIFAGCEPHNFSRLKRGNFAPQPVNEFRPRSRITVIQEEMSWDDNILQSLDMFLSPSGIRTFDIGTL